MTFHICISRDKNCPLLKKWQPVNDAEENWKCDLAFLTLYYLVNKLQIKCFSKINYCYFICSNQLVQAAINYFIYTRQTAVNNSVTMNKYESIQLYLWTWVSIIQNSFIFKFFWKFHIKMWKLPYKNLLVNLSQHSMETCWMFITVFSQLPFCS